MAATTTAFGPGNLALRVNDAGGTLRNVSGSTGKVSSNFETKIGEFHVFGENYPIRTPGKKNATFTVTGVATTAINELRDLIENWYWGANDAARYFEIDLPDSDPGSIRYSGNVLLKSYKFDADAGSENPVMFEIELMPTGAIDRDVIAA